MKITFETNQKYKQLGDLFGLFFEDLNHAADGGLYAELLQNRDFEFDPIDNPSYHALTAWETTGNAHVDIREDEPPFANNPHYAVVEAEEGGGIANLGYSKGIPVSSGREYRIVLWARAESPMKMQVALADGVAEISLTEQWKRYEALLTSSVDDTTQRLLIKALNKGIFSLAYASLMPVDTWRGRENDLRKDIAQALADMKPKFLRFPGGCLTHDGQLDPDARNSIYNWKRTIGPVENRPARRNNWVYHQTMGLGFYEYFLYCEDMDCEPLPVVNAGLDPHHLRFAEGDLLKQYIQDAVDLIEFAKGGPDTYWGGVRAQMGHPAPFRLNYLAVGNEEIHERFHENMALFAQAIREKDPSIRIIGSASPVVHGKPYDMGWKYAREQKLDLVDEHYYQGPDWFLANWDHYAKYPAEGPKVFLGEYASWSNTMESALAEAAYMTGLQNAPGVNLACYAPMLCHVDYVNWKPDMLWFDNTRIMKTPNYHVQSMFMRHQGDWAVPVKATENEPGKSLSRAIAGTLRIVADDTSVRLSNIGLTMEGKEFSYEECVLPADGEFAFGQHTGDFSLRFDLERIGGRKGVLVRFGELNEKEYYQWTVGGWQNSDSGIEKRANGRGSCLTQSNLYLEDGHVYHMTLTLCSREIVTTVDGEEVNRITEKELRLKPLYLCASVEDASGDVILKAVNVQQNPVCAKIDLPSTGYTAEILCAPPHAENTLDEPEKVSPRITEGDLGADGAFTFEACSVTVLRLHEANI